MRNEITPAARTVVGRLTAILLTLRSGGSHSLTEMARLTGLPMSTVHRLAGDLAAHQLLRRDADGRYEVGANLLRLTGGDGFPDLEDRAPLVLVDLCAVMRRRARIGVLRGDRVAYIEKRPDAHAPTGWCEGATLPAHATALGKALLAYAPRESVGAVQQSLAVHTACTISTPQRLVMELHLVRLAGYAHSRGELVAGDCAVACPVFGPGGVAIAAIELQVGDLRRDVELCRATLDVTARGLSRELSLPSMEAGDRRRLRLLPGTPDGEIADSPHSIPRLR
jgi:DNA-binding IclR family transcriptional regulator